MYIVQYTFESGTFNNKCAIKKEKDFSWMFLLLEKSLL